MNFETKNINKKIPLTYDTWDKKEILAINKTLKSGQLTQSKKVQQLEGIVAKYHKRKYCLMLNSGSSANLIGVTAMKLQKKNKLKNNNEFIVPGIGWSTSYSPFIQNNLKLKFIDVNLSDFNLNADLLERNISKNTKGILAINILGNPCNYEKINIVANKYNLIVVEDNCESLGASLSKKKCGSFGLWSSLSSYYSHHISTIEGGFLLTDDHELFLISKSLRSHGWVRGEENNKYFNIKKYSIEQKKFLFIYPGFNLRSTELNAAIGIEQFKKIDKFVINRKKNYKIIKKIIDKYSNIVSIQKECGNSSWFGFGFIFKTNKTKFKLILKLLKKNRIETRPIVTGDFTRQPVIKYYKSINIKYNLKNCTKINNYGVMIGNSQVILNKMQILNLKNTFKEINNLIEN